MLTADLVRAFRRKGELKLRRLDKDVRARAEEIAAEYLARAKACEGDTRATVDEAFDDVVVAAREQKLAAGIKKLVLDACRFEADLQADPVELRATLFQAAAKARRAATSQDEFDREAVVAEVANSFSLETHDLERLLFGDLKSEQRLLEAAGGTATQLVDRYAEAQVQAVLLRAEEVVAEVKSKDPAAYRYLFRKLKFHRLMHSVQELEGGGYRVTISGPFSLLSATTKYGLQLALVVPAIRSCDRWSIQAKLRWGKDRSRLDFSAEGKRTGALEEPHLPDDVQKLYDRWVERHATGKSRWKPAINEELFVLPGVGVCVPDLVFEHTETGETAYLEVLGYWSRDAVFKRVELLEQGLQVPLVVAIPSRLRVDESVLPDELPGALYVFKGVLSAKAIEDRLARAH